MKRSLTHVELFNPQWWNITILNKNRIILTYCKVFSISHGGSVSRPNYKNWYLPGIYLDVPELLQTFYTEQPPCRASAGLCPARLPPSLYFRWKGLEELPLPPVALTCSPTGPSGTKCTGCSFSKFRVLGSAPFLINRRTASNCVTRYCRLAATWRAVFPL